MRYELRCVLVLLLLLLTVWPLACSGGKQSAVEGKLVDWDSKPVAGVKITASQVQPIKGYEQFEAVTNSDGTFRIKGLFPSSQYVLKPSSDKWTCKTEVKLDSAPQGETAVLRAPMVIAQALSKSGSLVVDLATCATRFTVSSEGVITDSKTGLEWIVGPDRDTDYSEAQQWLAKCNAAGGDWHMPTFDQVRSLRLKGIGTRNMDPAFKTTGTKVWYPNNSNHVFCFVYGENLWVGEGTARSNKPRVFGVRSHPRGELSALKSEPTAIDRRAEADLRNAATAQEAYFIDNKTYTTSLDRLLGPTYGFYLSDGVKITIEKADKKNYSMVAFHEKGTKKYVLQGPGGVIQVLAK